MISFGFCWNTFELKLSKVVFYLVYVFATPFFHGSPPFQCILYTLQRNFVILLITRSIFSIGFHSLFFYKVFTIPNFVWRAPTFFLFWQMLLHRCMNSSWLLCRPFQLLINLNLLWWRWIIFEHKRVKILKLQQMEIIHTFTKWQSNLLK